MLINQTIPLGKYFCPAKYFFCQSVIFCWLCLSPLSPGNRHKLVNCAVLARQSSPRALYQAKVIYNVASHSVGPFLQRVLKQSCFSSESLVLLFLGLGDRGRLNSTIFTPALGVGASKRKEDLKTGAMSWSFASFLLDPKIYKH